ncbi:MAG: DUF4352 domain-containing protein [Thiobacillus sp.]|nr:DUF4352 domain-containing protein [Thiobacillus sp.]
MAKAGSIIAIIAGVLGLVAGFFTLFAGGIGSAFNTDNAGMVIGLGWNGIVASILVIVSGGLGFAKQRAGGMLSLMFSIYGIAVGGTMVAICLALAFIAGVLLIFDPAQPDVEPLAKRWRTLALGIAGGIGMANLAMIWTGGNPTAGAVEQPAKMASTAATLAIGATATGEQFAVTVNSARWMDVLGDGLFRENASQDAVFAVLDITVKCIDRESRWYVPGDLTVVVDGQELRFDQQENIVGVTADFSVINPMMTQRGLVVYKLPRTVMNAAISWHPGRGFGPGGFLLHRSAPANAPVAETVPPPASTPSANMREYKKGGSTLTVTEKANGTLKFDLFALAESGNSGTASGRIQARDGTATWADKEMDCKLAFRWHGNAIQVTQEGLCGFAPDVEADGEYAMVGPRP